MRRKPSGRQPVRWQKHKLSRAIPLALAHHGGENLISRAQARRVVARAGNFAEVVLDFAGVAEIGRQFADEIFRVWAGAPPQMRLHRVQACQNVGVMIPYALTDARETSTAKAA